MGSCSYIGIMVSNPAYIVITWDHIHTLEIVSIPAYIVFIWGRIHTLEIVSIPAYIVFMRDHIHTLEIVSIPAYIVFMRDHIHTLEIVFLLTSYNLYIELCPNTGLCQQFCYIVLGTSRYAKYAGR